MNLLSRFLSSRVTLGACALVLAGSAVVGRIAQADEDQLDRQTTEQECRSEITGDLDVLTAESLLRIERALAAIDRGESYSDVIDESELVTGPDGPFETAIKARAAAVAICSKEAP